MFGAIIGDIVGSVYEFDNIKTKNFPFFSKDCGFTDDSVMTVAVACALIKSIEEKQSFQNTLIEQMQCWGRKYPYSGYGGMFYSWLKSRNPKPYNSFGNGSAMRVSPCGLIAATLDEALKLSEASAEVTHNHTEGIKGAKATAAAIFLAKTGKSKQEIKEYIENNFYNLLFTLDEIRSVYSFNETCQNTVPQSIACFLESESYEDAIRNAVSLGGDSDTLGAITGAIAWSFYKAQNGGNLSPDMEQLKEQAKTYLTDDFIKVIEKFDKICDNREESFKNAGDLSVIIL